MFRVGDVVRVELRPDLGDCVVLGVDPGEGSYELQSKATGTIFSIDGSFVWGVER